MRKRGTLARCTAVILLFSVMLGGCKSRTKGTKLEKTDSQRAEAMLDDFCAYLKIGRFDRLSKMVSGTSNEVEKAKGYSKSEVARVFEAALQRIDYKVRDVEADASAKTGTARLVIKYFDTSILTGRSSAELKEAVDKAEDKNLEFQVKVTYEDEWLVDKDSADEILRGLFSFFDELGLGTDATESTSEQNLPPYRVYHETWYDASFNEVSVVHESQTHLYYFVTTWDYYNNYTMSYEFLDGNGNQLAKGTNKMGVSDDLIECELKLDDKLPLGTMLCRVYGPDGKLFTEGGLRVVTDDTDLSNEFGIESIGLVDKIGNLVPGYTVGSVDVHVNVTCSKPITEILLDYEIYKEEDYASGGAPFLTGSYGYKTDQPTNVFDVYISDITEEPKGKYVLLIKDSLNRPFMDLHFQFIEKGETFANDKETATLSESYWGTADLVPATMDEIKKGTAEVQFIFVIEEEPLCMQFPYKVTGPDDTVLAEGTVLLLNRDMIGEILVKLPEDITGELTCTVFNPDGSELITSKIEVKE